MYSKRHLIVPLALSDVKGETIMPTVNRDFDRPDVTDENLTEISFEHAGLPADSGAVRPRGALLVLPLSLVLLGGLLSAAAPVGAAHTTTVGVTPHGTSLSFHVTSSAPVGVNISVEHCYITDFNPINVDCFPKGSLNMDHLPKRTSWNLVFNGLHPSGRHKWTVTTRDAAGATITRTGKASTLKRKVSILFNNIFVVDDTDELSEGDLQFKFRTQNTYHPELDSEEVSTGSSEMVEPRPERTKVLDGQLGETVRLYVWGQDDDCGFFDGLCGPSTFPNWDAGKNDIASWATASTTLTIRQNEGPGSEAYSEPFSFATLGTELKFWVYGTIEVSYHA